MMKNKLLCSMCFLLICLAPLCGQTISVKGNVISKTDGEPVIGASVIETGTTNGVITDFNGDFTLSVTANSTLTISYIGYKNVVVKPKSPLKIEMEEDSKLIDEVVVTGYSTQRKADLTGAIVVVSVDDMKKQAENNPMKALQGKVAGMMITNDGNPAGKGDVRIRGIGTLNNNDPLYIIDGVPTKSGMHELNSSDIESIQVLKDASSASIYGSRAANGVIIITTKQGKEGKIQINLNAGITTSWYASKIDMLDTEGYGQALWQASVNSGKDPNNNNVGYTFDWGYDAEGKAQLHKTVLPEYIDAARTMKSSDTDWFDAVTRAGVMQNYDLSVSNGTDKGRYFFSVGYLKNEGLIKNSEFDRLSARINTDFKLWGGIITIGENFTINNTHEIEAPGGVLNTALQALPVIPIHTVDGGWGGPTGGMNDRHNPVRLVDAVKDNRYSYWRTFGNAFVAINPLKDLELRTNFGLDYGNYFKRDLGRKYQSGYLENDINWVNMNQGHWLKWNWNALISYKLNIGKHRMDALAGVELFRQTDTNFASYREGFEIESPEYMWPDLGTGKSISSGSSTGYALLSYFGKVNYSYNDRYLVSATLRYDGSSRFGKNNRFGTFPAFSLGWRLSEENFIKENTNIFSDLKLRFGWGQTGNQEISNTAVYNIYGPDYGLGDPTWNVIRSTSYDISGKGSGDLPSGFRLAQLANDDLKWETTTQTNIGIDFSLWNNSLYGTAEYYMKKTKDILILPPYLAVIGEGGSRWVNGASMENWGLEFTLGYRNKTNFGLAYDVTANLSSYRNEVTYLPEDVQNSYGGNGDKDNILGHPLNSIYGYVADGLFRTQDEINNGVEQDGKGLGRIRYKDLNGDGKITDADRTWIGVPHPDFMYGLNINLEYKNFDLTMFWQGVYNTDVINDQKYHTDFWSVSETGSNKGVRLLDAWSPSNPDSSIPALSITDSNWESRMSTYFVENGSYLKLRTLQLGYSLPKVYSKRIGLEQFRLYVSGQNLLTIKSKSFTGIDPETPGFGYPIPMTFTVGANITF
ncbi:MAG: SusC/RagA family TonB-linked outer membrane protein [Syntrophorhabdus sp.]